MDDISCSAENISNEKKGVVEILKQRVAQLEAQVDVLETNEKELKRRGLEIEEEHTIKVNKLSEEVKVLKDTSSNKMSNLDLEGGPGSKGTQPGSPLWLWVKKNWAHLPTWAHVICLNVPSLLTLALENLYWVVLKTEASHCEASQPSNDSSSS